ncbi:MAG: hypothetical protein ACHQE5_04120 [Actinomycetes bacterium]
MAHQALRRRRDERRSPWSPSESCIEVGDQAVAEGRSDEFIDSSRVPSDLLADRHAVRRPGCGTHLSMVPDRAPELPTGERHVGVAVSDVTDPLDSMAAA